MSSRATISNKRRWVVKVGSALLTDDGAGLNVQFIKKLATQIDYLREQGIEVILVSSGSVAAGLGQIGFTSRPERIDELQAAAAIGQATLIRHYEQVFEPLGIAIAQILLTHADIENRARYLNARNTLHKLLELKVLAVINENDTVATDEICFGDNDNLAAMVASLVEADLLVILTDQDGLYTADPRMDTSATLLTDVQADDSSLLKMASGSGTLGRGGMVTKLQAAKNAGRSGASTIIANGRTEQILAKLYRTEELGTLLHANQRLALKKQWMAGQVRIHGRLTIDAGAAKVLKEEGRSLLSVGVCQVDGEFERGALVSCVDESDKEIARGLCNYSAVEAAKLAGNSSELISEIIGYQGEDELIHRSNMVVL